MGESPKPVCTLVPAALVKEQLTAAWVASMAADPRRFRYFRSSAGSSWAPEVAEHDWIYLQRAVLLGDQVVGFLAAHIDRDCQTVTELQMLTFRPGCVAFLRAAQGFMEWLLVRFRSVRWSCLDGNPVNRGYARWAKRHGGGVLCKTPYSARVEEQLVGSTSYLVLGNPSP